MIPICPALQWLFPDGASSVSDQVDWLYYFLIGVSGFFSALITLSIIYFAIRYRRRQSDETPRPIEGSIKLEAVWTVVPFIIAMVMFGWGAKVYFDIRREPAEVMDIFVVGKQWMWKFQHLEGQREINELHVPVGRNVKLTMSTEDVIHSFFIPAFRIKQDVVPGRYTTLWFRATKPGRYRLYCAEYCGTEHSGMIGWVVVLEPAEYQSWLAGGVPDAPLAESGERLFRELACDTCHRPDSQGRGPVLDGVFGSEVLLATGQRVVADEAYLRESIMNPGAKLVAGYDPIMPTFQGLITEEQLIQLVAYIKSLRAPRGSDGGESGEGAGTRGDSSRVRGIESPFAMGDSRQ